MKIDTCANKHILKKLKFLSGFDKKSQFSENNNVLQKDNHIQ